ncbi:MAG: AAA family ATPase [Tepidisphaera sp.]|nr:AAA family ATPase [Tepidisphaera sp.]
MEKIIKAGSTSLYIFNEILWSRVPQFMYFDEYYQMRGCDNIEQLKARVDGDKLKKPDYPLLGLIRLARLDLDGLLNPKRTRELKNKLEGAGNHLTASIVKYWSQNRHLQMRFDVRPARPEDPPDMRQGTNIWAEIYDTQHQVTTELGSRSRGFVWFFSFLAWYGDVQREKKNVILLLDEPGLSLHGKAQADLLRYFETELKPNHQVIYSTHSPFMVDATRFDRVRIVQDRSVESAEPVPPEAEGTKVTSDVLEATDDSLFPLQGALGYDLTQTLFVGPNSLIVEGVSDLLYLQAMSGLLQAEGRVGLLPDWTITPVGGADKVPTFVALLGAQKAINLVTLIDFQAKDQQTIENLWRRKLIQRKNVLTFANFVQKPEADIEDLFGDDLYLRFVNGEYQTALTTATLGAQPPRVLVRIEKYFTANPMAKGATFNHYRPARYMAERAGEMRKHMGGDVLDRFESMFKAVNELVRRND